MSRRCELTGKGPVVGHNVSHAHNISLRRWNVNLQKVRVIINGRVVRIRVSTQAIKSGLIVRPPTIARKRPAKEPRKSTSALAHQGIIKDEEPPKGFFTEGSVATRIFKPKPKTEETVTPELQIPDFDAPGPLFEELDGAPKPKKKRF